MGQAFLKKEHLHALDRPDCFKAKSRVLNHLVLWTSGACMLSPQDRTRYTDDVLMQNLQQQPLAVIVQSFGESLKKDGHALAFQSLLEQATLLAQEEDLPDQSLWDLF